MNHKTNRVNRHVTNRLPTGPPPDRPINWPTKLFRYLVMTQVTHWVNTNVINRVNQQLTSQFTDPLSDQTINQPMVQTIYLLSTGNLGERLIEWLFDQTNNRPSSLPRKQPIYLPIYIPINPLLNCTFVIEFTNIRLSFKYWFSKFALLSLKIIKVFYKKSPPTQ